MQVCKEYISRLKCYDVMPQWTEIIAIDSKTPVSLRSLNCDPMGATLPLGRDRWSTRCQESNLMIGSFEKNQLRNLFFSTQLDKVFHILRLRQRAITATVWDSAENTVQGVCDVRQLFRSFWQDQTVSRLTNLGERMSKPFSEFFYRGPNGVPAESK